MTTLAAQPSGSVTQLSIASDALVLVADLQAGIADLSLTLPLPQFKRSVGALMKLVAIFDLPLIVTAVPGNDGTVSKLIDEVETGRRDAAVMVRTTPNSFNDANIRQAIEATQRKTLIISGAATEVAVQLPAITAASEGYNVHVLIDACAGISPRTEQAALLRLSQAGVHISSIPSLVGELAGDFRQPKGQQAIGVLFELAGG